MTKPSDSLSTMDWLMLRDRELRARGCDPHERVDYTGHFRVLSSRYVRTVGNWGRMSLREMCSPSEPARAVVKVKIGALRQFRWQHGLMSKSEFEAHYGPLDKRPWLMGKVCWEAHEAVQRRIGPRQSIGMACMRAVSNSDLLLSGARSLGLLPVEVVLYARHFDRFVRHLPVQGLLTYDEWCEASDDTKTAYWNLGEGEDSHPWGDISTPGPHLVASTEPTSFRPARAGQLHGPGRPTRAAG